MDGLHCSECAKKNHGYKPEDYGSIDFTSGSAMEIKFKKHTTYPTVSGIISVYTSSSDKEYNNLIIASIYSGSVYVRNGNIDYALWYVSDYLGDTYINTSQSHKCFENKVVKLTDLTRTHGYCTNSFSSHQGNCVDCNKIIYY